MDPSDYMKDPRAAVQSQLSTSLPGINTFVTTYDPETQKSKLHSTREGSWNHLDDKKVGVSYIYTLPHNADLNDDKDLKESDELIQGKKVGLTREDGTNAFYVDFSPGYEYAMHKTQSVDFGIVLEGTIEMGLEDGSKSLMRLGDVAVQRGTLHCWKNPSNELWARMVFILQATQPIKGVSDKETEAA